MQRCRSPGVAPPRWPPRVSGRRLSASGPIPLHSSSRPGGVDTSRGRGGLRPQVHEAVGPPTEPESPKKITTWPVIPPLVEILIFLAVSFLILAAMPPTVADVAPVRSVP